MNLTHYLYLRTILQTCNRPYSKNKQLI